MKDYLDVFSASHKRVSQHKIDDQDFLDAFYECFMKKSEDIASRFSHTDMARQREHLEMSLNHMIYFSIDRRASDDLLQVATRHNHNNLAIPPDLYDVWLNSLLEVVSRFDPEFDAEIDLAWRVLLAPGIAYMRGHFKRS